ncbi:MAG: hypothetical protein ACMXYL_03935 [Candidatus Woesearchaeota archaeon]
MMFIRGDSLPLFGLGKKKEAKELGEKPPSIEDAVVHTTKEGVSPEDALKRTPDKPQSPVATQPTPSTAPEEEDLFADFPLFGEEEKEVTEKKPEEQEPPKEETTSFPLEDDETATIQSEPPAPPDNTEQDLTKSFDEEVPDLMDIPENTQVDVRIRGDVNTTDIPEANAPEQTYDVQNVEFADQSTGSQDPGEDTLLNYIVKKSKGRMELFIEMHDMRRLSEDIERLAEIEKKSDLGFIQVNEIHEHEKKLIISLRKNIEDMYRQFSLMDALIFENNENR